MGGGLLGDLLVFAPNAATLLALAAALPVWLGLYLRCRSEARRSRPALSLGKLDAIELERAVLLYEKVARRRDEIHRQRRSVAASWRARHRARVEFRKRYGPELEELERYARDLRATIIRLRCRPLRRYRSWIRLVSSRCALGRSLGCYGLLIALLGLAFYLLEPSISGPNAHASLDTFVLWQRLEGRLLLANWMAESLAAAAAPLLYALRRAQMYRAHLNHIRELSEFAALDPDRLIAQRQADAAGPAEDTHAAEQSEQAQSAADEVPEAPLAARTWFEVLGVPPSATLDEVKQAYKLLIKQNHPDRVHSMAPLFKELAEAETKKLNIAYDEALSYFREDDPTLATCTT